MLPFCDGDVCDLQGQRFTDTARDLTTGDTSLKSSVLVMGANHNFFNTEWTPGHRRRAGVGRLGRRRRARVRRANPDRLTAAEQRAVGTAYVAGAVHLFADGDQDVLPLFDGSRARVDSTGDAQVLSHAIGGGRDVRAPGRSAAALAPRRRADPAVPGRLRPERRVLRVPAEYGPAVAALVGRRRAAHARTFFEMSWTAAGQSGGLVARRSRST